MTTFLQLVKAESELEEAKLPTPLPVSLFSAKWNSEPNFCLLQASNPLEAELQRIV